MADGNDSQHRVGAGEEIQSEQDFSNWMSNLPQRLCDESLKNIAIPGSHDSFSFFLDKRSELAPDEPKIIRIIVAVFRCIGKQVVYNWSVSQNLTFKEQLDRGIRYFDLRISSRSKNSDIYFVHGLYGNKVESGLQEINDWLEAHPKEVVLVDFNHFYDMNSADHENLTSHMLEIFGNKVCPVMDIQETTLKVLWANQRQLIIFYHHESTTKSNPKLWPGTNVESPWPNTTEASQMIKFLEDHLTKGRPSDKFYVSQGVLTPTGYTIFKHLICGTIIKTLAPHAMKELLVFLKNKPVGPKGINIVIADAVELDGFVSKVLALNPSA